MSKTNLLLKPAQINTVKVRNGRINPIRVSLQAALVDIHREDVSVAMPQESSAAQGAKESAGGEHYTDDETFGRQITSVHKASGILLKILGLVFAAAVAIALLQQLFS